MPTKEYNISKMCTNKSKIFLSLNQLIITLQDFKSDLKLFPWIPNGYAKWLVLNYMCYLSLFTQFII